MTRAPAVPAAARSASYRASRARSCRLPPRATATVVRAKGNVERAGEVGGEVELRCRFRTQTVVDPMRFHHVPQLGAQ